jgi:hypothetical protein
MVPPATDPEESMTSSYVRVLVIQVVVLAMLWWLQHAFV